MTYSRQMTTEILVKPGPFCLVAPSHCLIRCWHIINKALWYYFQFQGHVYLATQDTNPQVVIEMYTLEIAANIPPPPPPPPPPPKKVSNIIVTENIKSNVYYHTFVAVI